MKKLSLFAGGALIFPALAFAVCGYFHFVPTSQILPNVPNTWHLAAGAQTGVLNNTSNKEVLQISVLSNEDAIQVNRCNGDKAIIVSANNSASCTLNKMQSVEWALAPGKTKGSAGTYTLQQA